MGSEYRSSNFSLLNSAREKTVIATELALADGNWRDLIERVRCSGMLIPIVLVTSSSTAELWWDALECGVDEIPARTSPSFSRMPISGNALRTMKGIPVHLFGEVRLDFH